MDATTEPLHHHLHHNVARFLHSTTSSLLLLFSTPKTMPTLPQSKICMPFLFSDSPHQLTPSPFESSQSNSVASTSAIKGVSSAESSSGFPSTVRVAGLSSSGKGGGPAFVGQVFSMCDLSGTGFMAVSTHFDIPFISKRTPELLKKLFQPLLRVRGMALFSGFHGFG